MSEIFLITRLLHCPAGLLPKCKLSKQRVPNLHVCMSRLCHCAAAWPIVAHLSDQLHVRAWQAKNWRQTHLMSHPCAFSALSVVSGRISKVLELNVNTGHPLMFQCDDSYTLVGAPLSPPANMRKINSCAAACLHSQKSLLQQEDKHTLKTLCIIIEFLNQFHNTCRDKKSPTQLLLICSLSLVKCAGF